MPWKRGQPYSQDLRDRVFAEADDGGTVGETATLLRVSVSYVSKVLSRRERTGEATTRPQRCHVKPKLAAFYEEIRQRVTDKPDATIAELQLWLRETHQVSASTGLICETLALLGLTRKKSRSGRVNRTVPTSRRHAWNGAGTSRVLIPPG